MKRIFGIALILALVASLALGSVALAAGPEEGVVSVTMEGNDFDFEVWTQTADVQDVFKGEAHSSLVMTQTVRYQASGQWTSDAPDIDRFGEFNGDGSLETESWYNSSAQWYLGESYTNYYVESDTRGILGQNMHFDGHFGGVRDVDQYKKQRDAELYAEGDYYMSLFSVDERGAPDYGLTFEAADSGSWGDFYLDTMQTTTEHGSGQYFTPDELIVDFVYTCPRWRSF